MERYVCTYYAHGIAGTTTTTETNTTRTEGHVCVIRQLTGRVVETSGQRFWYWEGRGEAMEDNGLLHHCDTRYLDYIEDPVVLVAINTRSSTVIPHNPSTTIPYLSL